MFKLFKRESQPKPLWLYFSSFTFENVENRLAQEVGTAQDGGIFLRQLILGITCACIGDFLRGAGDMVRNEMKHVSADVIAFEAASFCLFAVREKHMPMPEDPLDETDPDELVSAYRDVVRLLRQRIETLTGWSIQELWNRRILGHFQTTGVDDAAERLAGMLLTMRNVSKPAQEYGQMSSNLRLNIELRGRVHAFASTIPEGAAAVIQNMVSEYNLDF